MPLDDPSDAEPPGHEGEIRIGEPLACGAPAGLAPLRARFVRYPGCQQLVLWLPLHGWQPWGRLRVQHDVAGLALLDEAVSRLVGGSVQIVLDTWRWPPGAMTVRIGHQDGWHLELPLHKSEDGRPPVLPQPSPLGDPGEDLALRPAVLQTMAARFGRRLEIDGTARAGTLTYVEGELRIRFDHEMGGGDAAMVVALPPAAEWEHRTGVALERRDEIVAFVAERMQQQASWPFEITDDAIVFRRERRHRRDR